jgi:hypothetical protein
MAKKTAAQLQREIDDVLRNPGGRPPQRQARTSTKATFTKAAKQANDQIYDLIHNRYFQSIPNDDLFSIVKRAGFRFDPEEEEFILVGRDGKATWQLRDENGQEVDHMLVLNWHKLDNTGRYEIVAYVS